MSGINYLLDTNIIIGLYENQPAVMQLLQTRQIKIQQCAYSAITRMELLSFPALTVLEKQAIESLLARMTYLAITTEIENETIAFRREHKTKLPDSIIAATARQARIELLTLDQKLAGKL
ncbi:MAG: type II toxin-antitoxin system VapC family toxin [Gallionella sp.]|jgi:hypothetical protein